MRITRVLPTALLAVAGAVVLAFAGPEAPDRVPSERVAAVVAPDAGPGRRIAWVAPAGSDAERAARVAVLAAERAGAEAEARFPRDRFEQATSIRYLRARGFEVRQLVPASG